MENVEKWIFNNVLPKVFRGIEVILFFGLIYGLVMMIINIVNEIY